MKSKYAYILIIFIVLTSLYGCKSNDSPPVLPVENFFRKPDKTMFQISPSGKYISYLTQWKGYMNIYIRHIDQEDTLRISNSDNGDIKEYFWKNDSTLIARAPDGNSEQLNLYSVDTKSESMTKLIDENDIEIKIINRLQNNFSEMLIALNKRDKRFYDLYRLNIYTKRLTMVEENPGNITWWYTDNEGIVRIAITSDGVNTGLLYRKNESDNYNQVLRTNFKDFIDPVAFTPDNKYIYAITNINRDKSALVEYDLENNKEINNIYSNDEVDLDWAFTSEITNQICGVSYTTWKKQYKFFCPDWEESFNKMSKKLPDRNITLVNSDRKEESFLFKSYSDKSPGEYYIFNTVTDELIKLADIKPWIDENSMASMKAISYESRDGLTIHGYLTIPNGKIPYKLPVVIFPHEGLWKRNQWEFNSDVQFFANRGYAVFQMNFRGSHGYGKNFWQAGFKQLGRKVQDDITDGVNWLITQNIADPKRVAIYGKSLGGYDALMGLANTPELYSCGVVFSGVINILNLVESIPPQYEPFRDMMYEMIGNPIDDKIELEKFSPINLIDKFNVPLLIAHGDKDQRVKQYEVDKFAAALSTKNVPIKYIIQKGEGHSFINEKNSFELYTQIENFFDKNLRVRK